jgi:hypothetical protein
MHAAIIARRGAPHRLGGFSHRVGDALGAILTEAGASSSKPLAHFIEAQVGWTVAAGLNILDRLITLCAKEYY